jgi:hypothetical protein
MAIHVQVRECLDAFSIECEDYGSDIQDELGRFKVWVSNIAAHRPSHSRRSLEYRLRDSSRLRGTVLSFLQDLKEALQELRDSVTTKSSPRTVNTTTDFEELSRYQQAKMGLEKDDDEKNDDGEMSELSDEEMSELSGGETSELSQSDGETSELSDGEMFELSDEESVEDETPTQQAVTKIHDVITCLLRLSIALRNPARNNQRRYDPDITKAFVAHYTDHVRAKFPAAPEYLVDRLGKSMAKHRQYLRYRKSHSEKLRDELIEDDMDAWERPSTVATSVFVADTPQGPHLSLELGTETESVYTATSYEGSSMEDTNLQIPQWPTDAQEGSPFECPLCFGILEIETEIAWRHHVFEDIPPYVCTSGTCESAVKSFSRRHEWARHEEEMHRKLWRCPYGCLESIGSSEGFKSHVRTVHHLADQIDTVRDLTAACGRASNKEGARSCPLCAKPCDSLKRWVKHVGHHLEQLTLFTLPMDSHSQDTPDGSDGRSDRGTDVEREVTQAAFMDAAHGDMANDSLEADPLSTGRASDQSMDKVIDADIPERQVANITDLANEVKALRAIIKMQDEERASHIPQDYNRPAPAEKAKEPKTKHDIDDLSRKIEDLRAWIEIEDAAKQEAMRLELEKKTLPIKFKDAVGRKFSFPWDVCKTWKGMEGLINQAFLHVDIIGEHVQQGHYDLLGPEGEIILPQVWEIMIKPDWQVTMHMWPLPETPRKERKKKKTPVLDPLLTFSIADESDEIPQGEQDSSAFGNAGKSDGIPQRIDSPAFGDADKSDGIPQKIDSPVLGGAGQGNEKSRKPRKRDMWFRRIVGGGR